MAFLRRSVKPTWLLYSSVTQEEVFFLLGSCLAERVFAQVL